MAHVEGTSSLDFFRVIPLVKHLLPKLRIDFSNVFNIKQFSVGSGREISRQLQQAYENWSSQYIRLPKLPYAVLYLRTVLLFLLFHR